MVRFPDFHVYFGLQEKRSHGSGRRIVDYLIFLLGYNHWRRIKGNGFCYFARTRSIFLVIAVSLSLT